VVYKSHENTAENAMEYNKPNPNKTLRRFVMNRRDEMNKIITDLNVSVNLLSITNDVLTKSNILKAISKNPPQSMPIILQSGIIKI
jgi:hypothetical protein